MSTDTEFFFIDSALKKSYGLQLSICPTCFESKTIHGKVICVQFVKVKGLYALEMSNDLFK